MMPSPYHSYDKLCAEFTNLGRRANEYEAISIGTSHEGRPITCYRLGTLQSARSFPRKYLVTATIHGLEWVGGLIALEVMRRLVTSDDPAIKEMRAGSEFWFVPCVNPDGYVATWQRAGEGSLATMRTNAHGVDLNRNFPHPPNPFKVPSWLGAGSLRRGDATYRGPFALSEPESRALAQLCEAQRFHTSANLHSFMGTVIPARVTDKRDYTIYRKLARAFARGKSGPYYPRLASRLFDTYTGELEDFQHHQCGTWGLCIETYPWYQSMLEHRKGDALFWRFNPRRPGMLIERDATGLLALFRASAHVPEPHQRLQTG